MVMVPSNTAFLQTGPVMTRGISNEEQRVFETMEMKTLPLPGSSKGRGPAGKARGEQRAAVWWHRAPRAE